MTLKPLVSVLIPVYNVERYVAQAIGSIMNQTYKNLEIVVVDDASTDATYELCCQMASLDKRIKLLRNSNNLGVANTLNKAWVASSGEYISRMDGDDISSLDRIEKQYEYLQENTDIQLVGVSLIGIDSNNIEINRFEHLSGYQLLKKSLRYVTPVSHVWLARRSVYEILNGYRIIPGCEDYDFLLRMSSMGMQFDNIPDYFGYSVRIQRLGNTVSTIGLKQRKIFAYVYSLYCERLDRGFDTHSNERIESASTASLALQFLFNKSTIFLDKALLSYHKKRIIQSLIFLLVSMIYPAQINYLYKRFRYRLLLREQRRIRCAKS